MGCLKIGGRVVGGTDGPSESYPACYRSAGARRRLGCDGPPLNAVEEKKRELGIDDRAEEFRTFLDGLGLSGDDIATAMELAGFSTPAVDAAKSTAAMDRMFPLRNRLHGNNGKVDPKTHAAFNDKFGTGRIAHDAYDGSWADTPTSVPLPSTIDERMAQMFPHANRLKR